MLFAAQWIQLLAQIDSLTGGAGWVGAGLLGMVLGWLLLKHLPDKDRQHKEEMERHLAAEKEQREDFTKALQVLMTHHSGQIKDLANAIKEDLQANAKGIMEMLNR